jgi:hypothetical protein
VRGGGEALWNGIGLGFAVPRRLRGALGAAEPSDNPKKRTVKKGIVNKCFTAFTLTALPETAKQLQRSARARANACLS